MTKFADELVELIPKLKKRALRLTKCPSEAEDLVQTVLVKAIAAKQQYKPGTNLIRWLMTILRNQFLENLRNAWRVVEDPDNTISDQIITDPVQEKRQEVMELIDRIPANRRDLMSLFLQGYEILEIARALNVAEGTVKSQIHRVRRKLIIDEV